MSTSRTPSLAEVLLTAIDTTLTGVHVALPAKVLAYDASKQSVDVQPMLRQGVEQPDGSYESKRLPVLNALPVVFPGAGGFRITFPVQVGDTCLVVFADGSLDRWKADGVEADETDRRRHHLADAVAIVGLNPFSSPWSGASTSDMTLGKDGGPQVTLKAGEIDLAGNTDAVIKGTTYRANEDVLLTSIQQVLAAVAQILSTPQIQTAVAAFNAAKASFDAQSALYLSQIVKVT